MSPAAVDFLSPFTSPPQMQSKQQQSFTPQNPNPNPCSSYHFGTFSLNNLAGQHQDSLGGGSETANSSNVKNVSEGGLGSGFSSPFASQMSSDRANGSAVLGRSKPRLVKMRRKLRSQPGKSTSVPAQNNSSFNQVRSATLGTSNGFNVSIGDFKCGKLDNAGFPCAANKQIPTSNLNTENKKCGGPWGQASAGGRGESSKDEGIFVDGIGTIKEEHKSEIRNVDEKGFVFGAKHVNLTSKSSLEKKEFSEYFEKSTSDAREKMKLDSGKVDNAGFAFGSRWSELMTGSNSAKSEVGNTGGISVSVECQKIESEAQLRNFGSMNFVFGAFPKVSPSTSNFRKVETSVSASNLEVEDGKKKVNIESELQKAKASDAFVFGSVSKTNSLFTRNIELTDEVNKVDSKDSGNLTGFANISIGTSGSVVNNMPNFVCESNVNTERVSGQSTESKLSDEMRKLTVDDCEQFGCSDDKKDSNVDSLASSNHLFLFGSNKESAGSCTGTSKNISCDQIKDTNLQGPEIGGAVEETGGKTNLGTIDENISASASVDDAGCCSDRGVHHFMSNEKNKYTRGGLGNLDEQLNVRSSFKSLWEEKQPKHVNEKSSNDPSVGISTPKPFTFQAGLGKSTDEPRNRPKDYLKLNSSSKQSSFSSSGINFEVPSVGKVENNGRFNFASTPTVRGACTAEFSTPNREASCSFAVNPYPWFNKKLEFSERSRSIRDKRSKKTRGKLRHAVPVQKQSTQDSVSKERTQQDVESPGRYSPMDFSPYQDDCSSPFTVNTTSPRHAKDEDLAAVRGGNIIVENKHCEEPNEKVAQSDCEAVCRNSKSVPISINNDGGLAGDADSSNTKRVESESKEQFCFASSAEDMGLGSFTFSLSSTQDNLSVKKRQNRKKYKMKVGHGPNYTTPSCKVDTKSSSVQVKSYSPMNQALDKERDTFDSQRNWQKKSEGDEEHGKQGPTAATNACEKWRIRGNQAYDRGYLSKAEECYTKGINSVPHSETSRCCIEPLVLCYSNRAAAQMSSGRMREALGDCVIAAALDPNFHKVQIRAANCHLALGEVEDALIYFNKCLESEGAVCLDRRIIIEAANGLQKAQKVAECMNQCTELLQERTSSATIRALDMISTALSLSSYSEKLLQMKGEALLMLRRFDEVIQFCEQTLIVAEKNSPVVAGNNNSVNMDGPKHDDSSIRLWRWWLMSKSYFHLGRLEAALDILEKPELLRSTGDGSGSNTQESLIAFAVCVRELLCRKHAGNEAFQSGKYTEAVEHYTAALLSSIESRPFAAICFCNRAAAHQALGQIADAIADCSLAIALDGSYSKAISRRATLHETIRDYQQASTDLQRLICLLEKREEEKVKQSGTPDRSTGSIVKELRQTRSRLLSQKEKAKKGISLDHYLILGIKPSDTASEIKKAYRKAALRHHPDKACQFLARSESGDDGHLWKEIADEVRKDADRLFKMIGEAYGVLSDPTKRSEYDLQEELRNVQKENNLARASRGSSDFHYSQFGGSGNSRRYW